MFDQYWMEYFQREDPFAYYCILCLQFLITVLFYCSYLVLFIVFIIPVFMIYSGTKEIKIKFIEDKQYKKLRKEREKNQELHQNLYFDHLDRNMKKKNKHK
jgi:hypothetical protein